MQAPLFVHWNNRPWPTNMIVIDNSRWDVLRWRPGAARETGRHWRPRPACCGCSRQDKGHHCCPTACSTTTTHTHTCACVHSPFRWFGIPSYYVQQMFRQAQGTAYLDTTVFTDPASEVGLAGWPPGQARQRIPGQPWLADTTALLSRGPHHQHTAHHRCHTPPSPPYHAAWQVHEEKVAASATCQSTACDRIAVKIVNFSSYLQRIAGSCAGAARPSARQPERGSCWESRCCGCRRCWVRRARCMAAPSSPRGKLRCLFCSPPERPRRCICGGRGGDGVPVVGPP